MMASFYEEHEFAIWAVIVLTLIVCFYVILNDPNILWRLSNPILKLMGGNPNG